MNDKLTFCPGRTRIISFASVADILITWQEVIANTGRSLQLGLNGISFGQASISAWCGRTPTGMFAFIASAQEQLECSAQLLAAAETLRENAGTLMTPNERVIYDHQVAAIHEGIDESTLQYLDQKA